MSLDQVKSAYEKAVGAIFDSHLRQSRGLFNVALIKFIYQPSVDEATKNNKDWPYLSKESTTFLRSKGFTCFAVNTPSIDEEHD